MTATNPVLTGGCQCGAVRFALSAVPVKISICHCRMCQKASGAPFASFADIPNEHFAWTRGKPIMTGAFDRPDRVIPTLQYGTESRLGWVGTIVNLPSKTTLQNYGPEKLGEIVSHQHPDHDQDAGTATGDV
jgi:hypothetical protein